MTEYKFGTWYPIEELKVGTLEEQWEKINKLRYLQKNDRFFYYANGEYCVERPFTNSYREVSHPVVVSSPWKVIDATHFMLLPPPPEENK